MKVLQRLVAASRLGTNFDSKQQMSTQSSKTIAVSTLVVLHWLEIAQTYLRCRSRQRRRPQRPSQPHSHFSPQASARWVCSAGAGSGKLHSQPDRLTNFSSKMDRRAQAV